MNVVPGYGRGFDCTTVLNAGTAAALRGVGKDFAVRYASGTSKDEIRAILGAGLGLMLVTYSREPGWRPSAELGTADGQKMTAQRASLGLPAGSTLWLDVEGCSGHAEDVTMYVNAWAAEVTAGGDEAGMYVGYQVLLSSDELFHDLAVTRYWQSCSLPKPPSVRGYCMKQLVPPNVFRVGVLVDDDEIVADALGDVPRMIVG